MAPLYREEPKTLRIQGEEQRTPIREKSAHLSIQENRYQLIQGAITHLYREKSKGRLIQGGT
jgi:hypothetical protein